MQEKPCFHIEPVANGFIVTRVHSIQESLARGPSHHEAREAPHVFESLPALVEHLYKHYGPPNNYASRATGDRARTASEVLARDAASTSGREDHLIHEAREAYLNTELEDAQ